LLRGSILLNYEEEESDESDQNDDQQAD